MDLKKIKCKIFSERVVFVCVRLIKKKKLKIEKRPKVLLYLEFTSIFRRLIFRLLENCTSDRLETEIAEWETSSRIHLTESPNASGSAFRFRSEICVQRLTV